METYDIYLRGRLMPHFGRLRLDHIDHVRVSAWFDAVSAERSGAANRAFEILRTMLAAARQWGELGVEAIIVGSAPLDGVGGGTIFTVAPSLSRMRPLVTTCSPACTPLSMMTLSPIG